MLGVKQFDGSEIIYDSSESYIMKGKKCPFPDMNYK